MIPGLPDADSAAVLTLLKQQRGLEQVLLYGSRAMGRHHSGSDVDLCLVAPSLQLEDLQLQHRIDHPGLLAHIDRVGVSLLNESAST